MEPNENQLHHHLASSYFTTTNTTATTTTPSPTNGLLPPGDGTHMVYPHSVPSSAAVTSPLEAGARRKRGRPRKYGTPEQALAAKRTASSSNNNNNSSSNKDKARDPASSPPFSGSSKKSQLAALGNVGQGFTPHVIDVAAGEDVGQKIMMFMQQSKREICILSASGSISNASLRQPATSGGNIAYEGRFDIISLSGSYVRTDIGGRTGGLSVCLSSTDGQIIGGGVGGPLKAAGPVQIIVGTFMIDTKKDVGAGVKGETSGSKLPSPIGGTSASSGGYRPTLESSGRNPVRGSDDHQNVGASHYMIQPRGMHLTPSRPMEWGASDVRSTSGYEMTGRTGHHHSPENGDYEQLPD
ncbi:DUF296 domain-containing protein [Cephalotus follicularis]|uniref:AT-hook motif nuclear-localized protein n=1 Tax=Cephalotus follicularis TaxID=3775 RepID=A0A1Q3BFH7_CEPFO|nr:DUF296 domain-containing protein [Cephalotus follicularis]